MDEARKFVQDKQIERTRKSLENHNFETHYVETKEELPAVLQTLIKEDDSVRVGGSVTLIEADIHTFLENGKYEYLRREDTKSAREYFLSAFDCDTYIASANAITEDGYIFNVDGTGNRVAAIIYGPKSVLVIAGVNKIVSNLDAAKERLRKIAAPANCRRLHKGTPCEVTGECVDCRTESRICRHYVVHGHQKPEKRIKVILVGEPLGY